MAINNTVELIGNIGSKAKIIETESSTFAVFSIATTDSYQNKESEEWKNKDSIWHEVICFSPNLIERIRAFDTGARLKIIGTLSYRPYPVQLDGKTFNKREANDIARSVEQAPLVKKTDTADS